MRGDGGALIPGCRAIFGHGNVAGLGEAPAVMPVLKIAAERGYTGWLVIEAEQDPVVRGPVEYQSMGLRTLKRMARVAGLDKGR